MISILLFGRTNNLKIRIKRGQNTNSCLDGLSIELTTSSQSYSLQLHQNEAKVFCRLAPAEEDSANEGLASSRGTTP
jgi:hypothetical protein